MIKIFTTLAIIAWIVFFTFGYMACFTPSLPYHLTSYGQAAFLTLIAAIPLTIISGYLKTFQ